MTAQPIEDDDPFADALLPRDRYKRPLIVPVEGGKPVPYTRASTFANELDNGGGLTTWKARTTALGIARNPDLAALAASLRYVEPGELPADAGFEVKEAHRAKLRDLREDKRALDEIIETAQTRVDDRASHGTAVHAFTDPFASPYVPERMDEDVKSYFAAMREYDIEQLLAEKFVVCDELQVAGTFDGTYAVPKSLLLAAGYLVEGDVSDVDVLIGDKKTGSLHEVAVAIQTAIYSRGQLYTPELDGSATREPLGVRQDVALLIHIPKGKGVTHLYLVDLRVGWANALLAAKVREANACKTIIKALPLPGATPAPAAPVAEAAAEAKPKRKRRTKAEMAAARAAEAPQTEAPSSGVGPLGDLTFEPDEPGCPDGCDNSPCAAVEIAAVEARVSPYVDGEPVNRDTGELTPDPAPSITEQLAANEAAIKARLEAERTAPAPTSFVSSPERDQALANAAANLKAQTVAPSMQEQIASAPTLDDLLALHGEHGATWTDDDKALATARRNLLIGGVATTAVTA